MATTANTYEFTYIITPVLSDEQIKDTVKRVNKYIENNGGTIIEVDEWGSRRLAYQINKKRNGYYVNMYFTAPGALVARLERTIEIDDNILRYLTLRMDKKMLRHYEQRKQKAADAATEPATDDAAAT
ncbi:MAG: 30S ribosomal protein S6 [Rhodothermales bacterium]